MTARGSRGDWEITQFLSGMFRNANLPRFSATRRLRRAGSCFHLVIIASLHHCQGAKFDYGMCSTGRSLTVSTMNQKDTSNSYSRVMDLDLLLSQRMAKSIG